MNQIIENLTRKPQPLKRFCVVVKPLGDDRFQVRDGGGRLFAADSTISWGVGDGVTVVSGRIVGRAVRFFNPKVYEV